MVLKKAPMRPFIGWCHKSGQARIRARARAKVKEMAAAIFRWMVCVLSVQMKSISRTGIINPNTRMLMRSAVQRA